MIGRLVITDNCSLKCVFILNAVIFIDALLNISFKKWKCNVSWFYLFDQGVPNETKGTINLKTKSGPSNTTVAFFDRMVAVQKLEAQLFDL